MEENNFNSNNSQGEQYQQTPQQEQQEQTEQTKSVGPIIGIAIILVIIIFGGLYYWGGQISNQGLREQQKNLTAAEILNQEDITLERLKIQETSDEITAIEEDLNLTDLNDLDKELENIDAELSI